MSINDSSLKTPVIAGLAVGVALVVLFASLFNSSIPIVQRKFYTGVSITGLKDAYHVGEKIDFMIRASGYGTNCGYPTAKVIDTGTGEVVRAIDAGIDVSCDPQPYDFDKTWTLEDLSLPDGLTISKPGHYKVIVDYSKTAEKEFVVFSSDSSMSVVGEQVQDGRVIAVSCQQLTLCTYQLKAGNNTYPINFRFNGTIENMTADLPTKTLFIKIKPASSGSLQIAVPRDVVDSRAGADGRSGVDKEFAVVLDDVFVDASELPKEAREWTKVLGISDNPEQYRMLSIAIPEGTDTVEIVGTMLI